MSIVNLAGERIFPAGEIEITDQVLDNLRNLIILRLRESGLTLLQISKVVGVHEATACRRLQKIRRQREEMERGGR